VQGRPQFDQAALPVAAGISDCNDKADMTPLNTKPAPPGWIVTTPYNRPMNYPSRPLRQIDFRTPWASRYASADGGLQCRLDCASLCRLRHGVPLWRRKRHALLVQSAAGPAGGSSGPGHRLLLCGLSEAASAEQSFACTKS